MNNHSIKAQLKLNHRDAFMWARHCCGHDHEDAREVVQIAYLKIMEGRARYHGKSTFKTWLFSVIRFSAIDYMKKKPITLPVDQLVMQAFEPSNGSHVNYEELLGRLSDRQRQVLLLAFYHDLTLVEISEVTDLSIGTVRTYYERGKRALKNLILKQTV